MRIQDKGITLVALILTIVILLILAVVTINSIQGDGIIAKALQSREKYEDAEYKEQGILDMFLREMEGISGTSQEGNSGLNDPTIDVGKNVIVGNLTTEGGTSSDNNSNDTENDNSLQEETIVVHKWAPIVDENGNNIIGKVVSQTENITVYDENKGKMILPAGFKIIADETTYNACRVGEGIVITDGTNEFVWIPTTQVKESTEYFIEPGVITSEGDRKYGADANIKNLKIINSILGTEYSNVNDFSKDLKSDFNAMVESVKKNGGFFVGRYETSLNNGKAQSVKDAFSATMTEDSANTWYGLYAYQKAYSTNSVQGSMMWGTQHEAMIWWLGRPTEIGERRNTTRITGAKDTDVIKNIYDLYGNSIECTLLSFPYACRAAFGGDYFEDKSPSDWSLVRPGETYTFYGSRMTLYIK